MKYFLVKLLLFSFVDLNFDFAIQRSTKQTKTNLGNQSEKKVGKNWIFLSFLRESSTFVSMYFNLQNAVSISCNI